MIIPFVLGENKQVVENLGITQRIAIQSLGLEMYNNKMI